MEQSNRELLAVGLAEYGVSPEGRTVDALARHLEMVADWNERINLTAITNERDMVIKHVIDSASALAVLKLTSGVRVLDVGTGAGFPGVVLKCLVPSTQVTLLESLNKRCVFLQAVGTEVIRELDGKLAGYRVEWGRAEEVGRKNGFREAFDVVVARAVAELRVLAEYCLPFCRVGGTFLAMKGPSVSEEVQAAAKALSLLGGEVAELREIHLPENAGTRSLIVIRKVRSTPDVYPRKAGTPGKSPL